MTTDNPKFQCGIPLSESTRPRDDYLYTQETERVVPTREKILQQALEIVTKDRNTDYGNPEDNFATIAAYWTTYLHSTGKLPIERDISALDVALMMIHLKISRAVTSPKKLDHYEDIAGYASCAGDCVDGNSR